MSVPVRRALRAAALLLAGLLAGGCASGPGHLAADSTPRPASAQALATAMARRPVVLLGEVHDNAAQHALRLAALQRLLDGGARPALAFEQIDRDRQEVVDRISREDGAVAARADRIIAEAGAKGWNWPLYRPYLVLALEHDLPIVAANLSRTQAMRVATEGVAAVFDGAQRMALGLDAVAPDIEAAQEHEIAQGHCGQVPADALPAMAAAQIARDAVLAQAIAPYFARGVVLLTGNGHVRRDIGVPRHFAPPDRERVLAIGLLEDDGTAAASADRFDVSFVTPVQSRADPCAQLRKSPLAPPPAMGTR